MMINPRDEYMFNKGFEEGMEKGFEEGMEKIAKNLKGKLPIKEIAECTGLDIEKVRSL